ncbi:hypothetical protein IV498_16480 [Paenarthrobacter sp. Z7-10]|nr:hypothetical protein [Paenarthrobacter sp. Z7-10]
MDSTPAWSALESVWPHLDRAQPQFSHGAFHHAAVLGQSVVARVSFANGHAAQTRSEHQNLEAFADLRLPFAVPSPVHEPFSTRAGPLSSIPL